MQRRQSEARHKGIHQSEAGSAGGWSHLAVGLAASPWDIQVLAVDVSIDTTCRK
jgi:hypothetical protein